MLITPPSKIIAVHVNCRSRAIQRGAVRVEAVQDWEPNYGRPAEAQARWETAHGRPLPDSIGSSG